MGFSEDLGYLDNNTLLKYQNFQISGMILLIAMIGAIVLTHVYRPTIKRQNINKQNMTFAKDRVELMKPKSGEGINSDD